MGFSVAVRHRLYATSVVAVLALLWAAPLFRRRSARPPQVADPARAEPSPDERAERLRLCMMLDQTPVPLVVADPDGALHAVNRAARTLFSADDLIIPRPPALTEALAARLPGDRTVLRLPHSSGGERSYALQSTIIGGVPGPRRLGVLTDIQSELHAAEACALRQLLQVLSHEIMNSLTPVASLAESAHAILVEEGAHGVARAAEALEVIRRRTSGLDGFVRGYRALARLPPPDLRSASVTTLLADAATLFRTRWGPLGLVLVTRGPVPDIIVACDAGQVTQALLILLANAVEAILDGAATASRDVRLSASSHWSGVRFLVADSGPGVPAGHSEEIFRPFFTTKAEGNGIGLALARQIALAHGGTLHLLSTGQSRGATFAFGIQDSAAPPIGSYGARP